MSKKRKSDRRSIKKISQEYVKHRTENELYEKMYKDIEFEYRNRKNLDITLEKIYVKRKLEQYVGETATSYIAILTSIITTLVSTLYRGIAPTGREYKDIMLFTLFGVAVIIFMAKWDRKKIRKESNEHIYYSIRLEVLEKLEKEKK